LLLVFGFSGLEAGAPVPLGMGVFVYSTMIYLIAAPFQVLLAT
jgi:hypothetical protein